MVNLSEEIKNKIKVLRKDFKLNPLEIKYHPIMKNDDKLFNLDTIKYWCKRIDSTGDIKAAKKSGRRRKLSKEQEKELVNLIDKSPKKCYNEIKRTIEFHHITRRTVNNYGLRNGIKTFRSLKKPPLEKNHVAERLKFCNEWLARPLDCKKLLIVDEKLFNGTPTNNYVPVKRRKGTGNRFRSEFISDRKRPSQNSSCNVLVSIGPFGKGELVLAEHIDFFHSDGSKKRTDGKPPGFDHTSYEYVINNFIIPIGRARMLNDYIFLQDNASIHTYSEKNEEKTNIQKIFEAENIELMKFPARSPDINPIENVLSFLSKEYSKLFDKLKYDYYPKNKKDTFNLLKMAWRNLDNDLVKKIYFSFYSRLLKVKEKKGMNNINY